MKGSFVLKKWTVLLFGLALALPGCGMKHKRGARVDAVIETYRENKAGTEVCYRRGLAEDPSLGGKILLSWKVDQSGKAQDTKVVRSDIANATVESCLLDHLKSLSFPAQARFSPALVEYELSFTHGKK